MIEIRRSDMRRENIPFEKQSMVRIKKRRDWSVWWGTPPKRSNAKCGVFQSWNGYHMGFPFTTI